MVDIQNVKQRFGIIGMSEGVNRSIEKSLRVAPTDISVLVTGESGVGKENIPKIIHQIHLGSSPLSDLEKKWQLSWKKNNPEYIYILWDEQKIAQHIEITHAQAFYDCKNFSEKSDIFV